mgnify:FL=1
MKWHGQSDTGQRREHNEDAWRVDEARGLALVADGMGGHAAGEIASRIVVTTVSTRLADELPPGSEAILALLRETVEAAHAAVLDAAKADPARRGMGSTATVAVVQYGYYYLAHIGDSRAYLLRDGHLHRLTRDHTIVEDMVMAGMLRPEEAETSPQRHILRQAVGADQLEVDLYRGLFMRGDVLLLCSDGLHDMLRDDQIEAILREYADMPDIAAQRLIDSANAVGGEDNITVVLVVGDDFTSVTERASTDTLGLAADNKMDGKDKGAEPIAVLPKSPRAHKLGCVSALCGALAVSVGICIWLSGYGYWWNLSAARPGLAHGSCGIVLAKPVILPTELSLQGLRTLTEDAPETHAAYTTLSRRRFPNADLAIGAFSSELKRTIGRLMEPPADDALPAEWDGYAMRLRSARTLAISFVKHDESLRTPIALIDRKLAAIAGQ